MGRYLRDVRGYQRDIRLFLLYNLAANVGIGVFTLLYNLYLTELGLREDFIGRFNSISTLAMAGVALSMGYLINSLGVWRCVTIGMGLFLVASFLTCVITDPNTLLVFSAFGGAATAFLFVPTMPFIVDLTRREERHGVAALAFSLQSLSVTVGSMVGGWFPKALTLVSELEAASAETYRYTLIAGLALAGLSLIPLVLMSAERKRFRPVDAEPAPASAPAAVGETRPAARNVRRDLWVFVAVGGLMSVGAGAVFPFYNVFLKTIGASAGQIGLIYAVAGLLAAFIGLFSPWFAQRFGPLQAVVLIRLAPVPFYLLLVAFPVLPLAIFGQVIRTISINMAWPIDSTYASDILPARERGKAFSFRSGAWNLGWSAASLVTGRLIVAWGYNVSFITYVVFMTLAMALFYIYFSRAARPHPASGVVSPLPREEREPAASG